MKRSEIEAGIRKVLVKVSNAKQSDIQLKHKLKTYVPPLAALIFALRVHQEFPEVNLTDLTNSLYDPLVTVKDLIDYVDGVYNPEKE